MRPQPILAILTLCVLVLPAATVLAGTAENGVPKADAPTGEAPQEAGPKAVANEPVKDFGRVPKGTILRHDYEITNKGDRDLEILRVTPACGCTVAKYDKVIKPGETGKVHAEINTAVLGARSHRLISVYTNDPERPLVQLVFDAELVPTLDIHPGYARYQVVHGEEEPGIIKQWVYSLDGQDFAVTGVDSPLPYLGVSFRKATEAERHAEVTEKAPGSPQWVVETNLDYNKAPIGAIAQEVVVHTDHKIQKEIVIPVSGFVRPAMWATPNELNLGKIEGGKPVRFSVVVQSFLTEPMEITGVELDGKKVESSVSPIENEEGHKYTVWITLELAQTAGPMRGKVQIRTSSPKNPVVEIPLRAQIL